MDEAHSVSEWGHSFRPAYLALGAAGAQLGSPPVLALTATATQWVRGDIVERLGMRGPQILVRGTDRPSLFFEVQRVADSKVTVLFEKAGYKTLGLQLVQANGLLQPV